MRGHAIADERQRMLAAAELKRELKGRLPKGPFEFAADLNFELTADEKDSPVVRRFKLAVERDARYSVASARYLSVFGMIQNVRSIYDGGGRLQDG